jgi:hypothetical protein
MRESDSIRPSRSQSSTRLGIAVVSPLGYREALFCLWTELQIPFEIAPSGLPLPEIAIYSSFRGGYLSGRSSIF